MIKKLFFIFLFLVIGMALSANVANAVFHEKYVTQGGAQEINIPNILLKVQGLLFGILILLAGVFILASAYFYLFSVSDPKKTEKARNMITYAVVAIIVAALSQGIVFIVKQLVGIEAPSASTAPSSVPWGRVGITPTPLPVSEQPL